MERGSARVTIDSFNIRLEVFIYSNSNFSIKLCEWFTKIDKEFTDLV